MTTSQIFAGNETVINGYREAIISRYIGANGDVRFVVAGRNGGRVKTFKTLDGARNYARKYVA